MPVWISDFQLKLLPTEKAKPCFSYIANHFSFETLILKSQVH